MHSLWVLLSTGKVSLGGTVTSLFDTRLNKIHAKGGESLFIVLNGQREQQLKNFLLLTMQEAYSA